jgi:hypothetical protein
MVLRHPSAIFVHRLDGTTTQSAVVFAEFDSLALDDLLHVPFKVSRTQGWRFHGG